MQIGRVARAILNRDVFPGVVLAILCGYPLAGSVPAVVRAVGEGALHEQPFALGVVVVADLFLAGMLAYVIPTTWLYIRLHYREDSQ